MEHEQNLNPTESEQGIAPAQIPSAADVAILNGSGFHQAAEKKHCSRIGWGFAAFAVIPTLVATLLLVILSAVSPSLAQNKNIQIVLSPVVIYLFALPVLLLIVTGLKPMPPQKRKLSFGGWLIFLVVSFGLMYIGNYIGIFVTTVLSSIFNPDYMNPIAELIGTDTLLVSFVVMVIIAPIGEELVFRKLLMDRLNRYGSLVSILVSGLMFGLMHGNFSQFFYAAMLGIVLGYLYNSTGKVWLTVAIHATINFFGSVVATLIGNGVLKMEEDLILLEENPETLTAFMAEHGVTMVILFLYFAVMLGAMICAVVLPIVLRRKIWFAAGDRTIPKEKALSTVLLNVGMIVMLAIYLVTMALSVF